MTKLFRNIAVKSASKEAEEKPAFKDLEVGNTFKLDSVNPSGRIYMKTKTQPIFDTELNAVILVDPFRQVATGKILFIKDTAYVSPITVEAIDYD